MTDRPDHDTPRTVVRNLTPEDIPAVIVLQHLCFPGLEPWSRRELRSQLRHFPDGQFVVVVDGKIVASASSLIVDEAEYLDWHDWEKVSDHGTIRNHDPEATSCTASTSRSTPTSAARSWRDGCTKPARSCAAPSTCGA